MELPLNPLAVANRFVELANESKTDLSLMKLLKLVYFAQGWYLGLTGKRLMNEKFEAWQFGPVAPEVYHNFKHFGASQITSPVHALINFDMDTPTTEMKFVTPTVPKNDGIDAFLKKIWDTYGKLTAFQLSQLTHQEDTPWNHIWNKSGGSQTKSTVIPDVEIINYFRGKKKVNAAA